MPPPPLSISDRAVARLSALRKQLHARSVDFSHTDLANSSAPSFASFTAGPSSPSHGPKDATSSPATASHEPNGRTPTISTGHDSRSPFCGKCILITGGASGIGAHFARSLVGQGALVVIADMNDELGRRLQSELNSNGRTQTLYIRTDVTSWTSQRAAFEAASSFSPQKQIDHVIGCAGLVGHIAEIPRKGANQVSVWSSQRQSLEDGEGKPREPQLDAINTVLMGGYYTALLAVHYLHQPRDKNEMATIPSDRSLLLLGSIASYRALPFAIDYSAAKFGIRGLFKALRTPLERTRSRLRVNMLAPQYVLTPMTEGDARDIEKRGFEFTDIRDVEAAMLRCLGDGSMTGTLFGRGGQVSVAHTSPYLETLLTPSPGRSIGITKDGPFDINDDLAGNDGWETTASLLQSGRVPMEDY